MDTQALNIVQQLKRTRESPWKAILRTLDGISIEGAISILHAFNYREEPVYQGNVKYDAEALADERAFPELQGRMAEETPPIWFWGGPPNKLHWYGGTLHTLMLDRVICEVNEHGSKHVAKWIGTDEC